VSVEQLQLVPPIVPTPGPPARRVMQYIENTFYEWDEFTIDPRDPDSSRFLRMRAPQTGWLSVAEARVLLTASGSWVDEVPGGQFTTTGPQGELQAIPMPLDLHGPDLPDLTSDSEWVPEPNGFFLITISVLLLFVTYRSRSNVA